VSFEAQIMNFICEKGHQLYENGLKIDREVVILEAGDTAGRKIVKAFVCQRKKTATSRLALGDVCE